MVKPPARRELTLAIGKPVALEARAEERDVRGLISITTTRSLTGSWANWTFVPPITSMASTMSYECFCSRACSSGEMVRLVYAQLSDATYEDAIGCLPSVANMWQQNVIDLAKASENYAKQKAKRVGTASSTRSVRCLSRR